MRNEALTIVDKLNNKEEQKKWLDQNDEEKQWFMPGDGAAGGYKAELVVQANLSIELVQWNQSPTYKPGDTEKFTPTKEIPTIQ